jgi:hypothetical protein
MQPLALSLVFTNDSPPHVYSHVRMGYRLAFGVRAGHSPRDTVTLELAAHRSTPAAAKETGFISSSDDLRVPCKSILRHKSSSRIDITNY